MSLTYADVCALQSASTYMGHDLSDDAAAALLLDTCLPSYYYSHAPCTDMYDALMPARHPLFGASMHSSHVSCIHRSDETARVSVTAHDGYNNYFCNDNCGRSSAWDRLCESMPLPYTRVSQHPHLVDTSDVLPSSSSAVAAAADLLWGNATLLTDDSAALVHKEVISVAPSSSSSTSHPSLVPKGKECGVGAMDRLSATCAQPVSTPSAFHAAACEEKKSRGQRIRWAEIVQPCAHATVGTDGVSDDPSPSPRDPRGGEAEERSAHHRGVRRGDVRVCGDGVDAATRLDDVLARTLLPDECITSYPPSRADVSPTILANTWLTATTRKTKHTGESRPWLYTRDTEKARHPPRISRTLLPDKANSVHDSDDAIHCDVVGSARPATHAHTSTTAAPAPAIAMTHMHTNSHPTPQSPAGIDTHRGALADYQLGPLCGRRGPVCRFRAQERWAGGSAVEIHCVRLPAGATNDGLVCAEQMAAMMQRAARRQRALSRAHRHIRALRVCRLGGGGGVLSETNTKACVRDRADGCTINEKVAQTIRVTTDALVSPPARVRVTSADECGHVYLVYQHVSEGSLRDCLCETSNASGSRLVQALRACDTSLWAAGRSAENEAANRKSELEEGKYDDHEDKQRERNDLRCVPYSHMWAVCQVMRQLLSALAFMHERGVVHGNITLDSVYVHNEEVQLSDLALSALLRHVPPPPSTSPNNSASTVNEEDRHHALHANSLVYADCTAKDKQDDGDDDTHAHAGGYGADAMSYCAPECLTTTTNDEAPHASMDMWSVGVLCYRLLCGYDPFDDGDATKQRALMQRAIVYLPDYFAHDARSFVRGLLCVSPRTRMTAAQALQHDFLQHVGGPATPQPAHISNPNDTWPVRTPHAVCEGAADSSDESVLPHSVTPSVANRIVTRRADRTHVSRLEKSDCTSRPTHRTHCSHHHTERKDEHTRPSTRERQAVHTTAEEEEELTRMWSSGELLHTHSKDGCHPRSGARLTRNETESRPSNGHDKAVRRATCGAHMCTPVDERFAWPPSRTPAEKEKEEPEESALVSATTEADATVSVSSLSLSRTRLFIASPPREWELTQHVVTESPPVAESALEEVKTDGKEMSASVKGGCITSIASSATRAAYGDDTSACALDERHDGNAWIRARANAALMQGANDKEDCHTLGKAWRYSGEGDDEEKEENVHSGGADATRCRAASSSSASSVSSSLSLCLSPSPMRWCGRRSPETEGALASCLFSRHGRAASLRRRESTRSPTPTQVSCTTIVTPATTTPHVGELHSVLMKDTSSVSASVSPTVYSCEKGVSELQEGCVRRDAWTRATIRAVVSPRRRDSRERTSSQGISRSNPRGSCENSAENGRATMERADEAGAVGGLCLSRTLRYSPEREETATRRSYE